jgi:D-3-phosphoglycerate dehydrogenase / 2-oxoglutarate reductase
VSLWFVFFPTRQRNNTPGYIDAPQPHADHHPMSESAFNIVVAETFDDDAIARLRKAGSVTVLQTCDEPALISAVKDADALVVRTRSNITRAVIEAGEKLKVIGRGGVGLDNIDLAAAREGNITVVYTPAAATDAVADLAVGMMIALTRRFGWAERMLRDERFAEARNTARHREMRDLTLGIIGMGRIGQAVAKRCRDGFAMTILYNDIRQVGLLDVTATPVTKDDLYHQADILSLHVPLTSETNNLIGDKTLAKLQTGAILINTARGPIVDNIALAKALESGKLGGAGLDVYDPEPLPFEHPLRSAPDTILLPHIGARTDRGLAGMNDVVDDVLRVLTGKSPHHPANL